MEAREREQFEMLKTEVGRLVDIVVILAQRLARLEGDEYVPSSEIAKVLYEEMQTAPNSGVIRRVYQGVIAP